MAKSRRISREIALQVLYQFDFTNQIDKSVLQEIIPKWGSDDPASEFTDTLCFGVKEHLPAIDKQIVSHSSNWSIDRISNIDKNILRIAIFELQYVNAIPPKVTINEAIEIAKKFGDEKSPSFINGILDGILKEGEA